MTTSMMEFQNPGKDDGAYFDDLLFDEPPVPERTRERASYVERRRRESREGSSDPQGEEEYEEMKDANAQKCHLLALICFASAVETSIWDVPLSQTTFGRQKGTSSAKPGSYVCCWPRRTSRRLGRLERQTHPSPRHRRPAARDSARFR